MSEHTPGPWQAEVDPERPRGSWVKGINGDWAALSCGDTDETALANACLIAAAPDHALLAWGLAHGHIRWEPNELCGFGLRHSTKLDQFGVPEITPALRDDLLRQQAEGKQPQHRER